MQTIYWTVLTAYVVGALCWVYATSWSNYGKKFYERIANIFYNLAVFIICGGVVFGLWAIAMWENHLWN